MVGLDFIRDGFLRVGLGRKALFLATGGLSGFVLKDTPKRRTAVKATAKPASRTKATKAKRAKARKPARPKATKPIQKVSRTQTTKATRAKTARKATKPRVARRPAEAPARVAAQAQPPAEAGPIRIERVAEPQPVGAPSPQFTPAPATPGGSEHVVRPGAGIGDPTRPVTPVRDPATYNAVESSAQAARRLAESAGDRDPSSPAFTSNGGNDARS
jgi:hypothetical protein